MIDVLWLLKNFASTKDGQRGECSFPFFRKKRKKSQGSKFTKEKILPLASINNQNRFHSHQEGLFSKIQLLLNNKFS